MYHKFNRIKVNKIFKILCNSYNRLLLLLFRFQTGGATGAIYENQENSCEDRDTCAAALY